MPIYVNTTSLMSEIRVLEVESIHICICLPMMPAFSKLVLQRIRRIFQVSDQPLGPYQRFRGGERRSFNRNIWWLSRDKVWEEANNNMPVDGIDRAVSIELSSEARQVQDLI